MACFRVCLKTAVLLALTAVSASTQPQPKKLSDAERKECLATGGSIGIMGLLGGEGCVHPMPDAGKPCTDGSQCKAG